MSVGWTVVVVAVWVGLSVLAILAIGELRP